MVFSSPIFLFLFLPVVLALYAVTPRVLRNLVLVVASLLFYAWGEPRFVPVMLASIALNWAFGLGVDAARGPRAARRVLALGVVANLGLLAVFKYADFAVANLNAVRAAFGATPLPLPHVVLPLGISFFTFHALSYVIDVYRRAAPAGRNPLSIALYISFFPQLIAGPIVRYHDIAAQIARRTVTLAGFATGVERFVRGLGKKVLIANTLAGPADAIFALSPAELTAPVAWLGVAAYTLQIYFDFSGYSDMAIGLAHMFGFRLPENFAHPYASRSLTEFWRRWHISLSTWFRDYLYVALGGNRRGRARTYVNLVTVFFLCGLWHGASWTFVAWGLFHGLFLVVERTGFGRWLAAWPPLLRHAYALAVVMAGWVLFRSPTLGGALAYLGAMAGGGRGLEGGIASQLDPAVVVALVAGVAGSAPLGALLARRRGRTTAPAGVVAVGRSAALLLVLVACAMMLAAGTHNPFLYFRF